MRFQPIRDCRRTEPEQRYIWASMMVFPRLSGRRREELRALIGELADTPEEGRALFTVLTRDGATPHTLNMSTGVPVQRIYRLRREFYDRFPMG